MQKRENYKKKENEWRKEKSTGRRIMNEDLRKQSKERKWIKKREINRMKNNEWKTRKL